MEVITDRLLPAGPTNGRGPTFFPLSVRKWLEFTFPMSVDPDAREISINYAGGSLVMTIGNAKSLFGEDSELLRPEGETQSVSVSGHSRTRVIGGPTTNVAAYTYTYTQWPVGSSSLASGGEAISMAWEGSDGFWTARLKGSAADLGTFLNSKSLVPVSFKTQRGTPYGPFIKEGPVNG